jgi:propanediol utilization protein
MALRTEIERIVRATLDRLITINVSARHLHITQEHLEVLFGPGHHLSKLRDLMQPGEFAANETVTVVGPNRRVFDSVRILGPVRKATQVELSFNDGRYLGMELPPRISGDIAGTAPMVLIGPRGALQLPEGTIRALRHIHVGREEASRLGLEQGQVVGVRVVGKMGLTFEHVMIRVGDRAKLEMHIDTDEANAAGITSGTLGLIV